MEAWREALAEHPDEEFGRYIVTGLAHGFRIGYESSRVHGASLPRNMQSTRGHPDVVQRYLDEEKVLGTLHGPVEHFSAMHVSTFGVIPKSGGGSSWIGQRRAVKVLTMAFPQRPVLLSIYAAR